MGLGLFFPFRSKSRRPLIYNLLFNHLNSLDTAASAQNNDRTTNERRAMIVSASKAKLFLISTNCQASISRRATLESDAPSACETIASSAIGARASTPLPTKAT
jgi:hypothetical protein